MSDAFVPFDTTKDGKRYFVGLLVVAIGYIVALTSSLATFRIPIALSSGMALIGLLAAILLSGWISPRLAVKQYSRAFFPTFVIGTLLIAAILRLFADSDWKTWYIHPAGFQSTWIVLVIAFFHLGRVFKSPGSRKLNLEISVSEYNKDQAQNPYAPPMRHELQMNKPMDRSGGSAAS